MQKVPHLTTALKGPLFELEKKCLKLHDEIEKWFSLQWEKYTPPIYGSVDLRNSGFKLAPVDMNLFPGGFNNLNPEFTPLAVNAIKKMLEQRYPQLKKILLIPENHTRNIAYLENVYALKNILEKSGFLVALGSVSEEINQTTEMDIDSDKKLVYHPLKREGDRLKTKMDFEPDLVLLNNDLTIGIPEILKGISQTILPPLNAGWYMRKKTNFFTEYDFICEEFARLIDIDPWQINPYFDIAEVDFENKIGLDKLATKVDKIISKTLIKYKEKNITYTPFVIVKANNGTYGRGIMVVKSGQEILEINRKSRNKMAVIKEGLNVNEVIIQEGVYTFEEVNKAVAEPVIYMANDFVIGGFYRVHPTRSITENLNAPGANFTPLHFSTPCIAKPDGTPDCASNRFYTYGVIARLSLLASSLELEK